MDRLLRIWQGRVLMDQDKDPSGGGGGEPAPNNDWAGCKNNKRVFWAEDRRFKPNADKRLCIGIYKGTKSRS